MIISESLVKGSPLTENEVKELEALEHWDIVFDDDSPEITEEMASKFKRVNPSQKLNNLRK